MHDVTNGRNRSWRLGLGALALVGGCAAGQVPAQNAAFRPLDVAATVVIEDRYPPGHVTFPNGVKSLPARTYSEPVGYRPLLLDLYLPPSSAQKPAQGYPLVVFIHGGVWLGGDRRRSGAFADFPAVLASLSAKGYVVASIDYRLSGEARFPAQIQDVKAAVRWLRSHASEYGIDPARAMTWGASAGAHLAALAAVTCGVQALEPDAHAASSAASDCVQGAVAWYGVFDIATIAIEAKQSEALSRDVPQAPEWLLLGCFAHSCKEGQMDAASPETYVDAQDPPMLLVVGADDRTVPYQQTMEMADKLQSSGVPYKTIVMPGIDHNFLGKTRAETRDASLKALDATFQFIDKTMSVARRGMMD